MIKLKKEIEDLKITFNINAVVGAEKVIPPIVFEIEEKQKDDKDKIHKDYDYTFETIVRQNGQNKTIKQLLIETGKIDE